MNEHKFYRQKYSIKDYSSQWFPWDSVKMVRFGGHFILSNPQNMFGLWGFEMDYFSNLARLGQVGNFVIERESQCVQEILNSGSKDP